MDKGQMKRFEDAKDPSRSFVQVSLAGDLIDRGDLDSARLVLEQVLEKDPGNLPASELLVQAHRHAGRVALAHKEQTRWAFQQTGISGPRAECDQAERCLLDGDLPRGWDLYEARHQVPGLITPQRHFTHPRWDGTPFPGKTLLLHYEQGLGDTLMFVRYAPLVKALGGRVLLAAQASLADVAATCRGIDGVIPKGTPPPPFDVHLPLLSLPWVFQTDLSTIPAEIPYLRVPEEVPNRRGLDHLLARSEGSLRVGLAWKGSSSHPRDLERSIQPGTLAPLAALPQVAWHSFQHEDDLAEPFPGIQPLAPLLSNFSDTAHALSAMDLVITVDTAVAHLAGAMGIPVLLMVTAHPDWRWMQGRDDSPWYPTLRLYRQPRAGDWDTVVQRVFLDLTNPD